jgi:hypothetical protein
MKLKNIILIFLLFSFLSPVKADDIKNFEIEGMSVGDSLLNYFSPNEIKQKISSRTTYWYPNNMHVSVLIKSDNFKIYDEIGAVFNSKNDKFILESIEGTFNYGSKINECYKKQNIITLDLKKTFSKNTEFLTYSRKYSPDKTGKSTSKYNRFTFPSGGSISVICYDMDKDFIDPNDQLYVAISSKEFIEMIGQIK